MKWKIGWPIDCPNHLHTMTMAFQFHLNFEEFYSKRQAEFFLLNPIIFVQLVKIVHWRPNLNWMFLTYTHSTMASRRIIMLDELCTFLFAFSTTFPLNFSPVHSVVGIIQHGHRSSVLVWTFEEMIARPLACLFSMQTLTFYPHPVVHLRQP